ncbi:MAG: nucleotidyl transferase AbiEii/AbiGii toxin family protein [Xanthomonadales bacterium]|nr:nucleotidyl transferase AbiEii/AbiGii toxin family protein [Xanthomonadales bacterium]
MVETLVMFERTHHRRIAQILSVIDGQQLRELHCWFAGGTAIVMRFGEFRESLDIDFMISDRDGYRALRQQVSGPDGVLAIMLPQQTVVEQLRKVRVDQGCTWDTSRWTRRSR